MSGIRKNSVNLISLVAIQGSNAILPLLVFPYILKKVGETNYSQIVIAEAVMFIAYAFVLYSFEVDGVSRVMQLVQEKKTVILSKLYTKILFIRLGILGIFALGFLVASLFLEKQMATLLFLWLLFPLGFILQSSYFYLAIEENFYLAVFVVLSRILCVWSIFTFIQQKEDAYLAPLLIGFTFLLGGLASFVFLLNRHQLKLYKISFSEVKILLQEGKEIFIGNISVLLFRDLNVLILGVFSISPALIASYSIAEKIIKSLQAAIRPLNQFFFPKGVKLIQNIKKPNPQAFKLLAKVTTVQLLCLFVLTLSLGIGMVYFKDKVDFLSKYPNIDTILVLGGIMIGSVFFGVMNFMFGTVGLNHLNAKKYYAYAILITGTVSILSALVVIKLGGVYGAAFSFVLAEIVLSLLILKKYFSKNKEIKRFQF